MRVTRRRRRRLDNFASPDWVRSVFHHLIRSYPRLSSYKDNDLVRLARAVRHVDRYSASDSRRGRPSRWPREDLVRMGSKLGEILDRETQGRISVSTFVDHYLRTLYFPSDILDSLSSGEVNLFEAEQLARLTANRLDLSESETRRIRSEILSAHLQSRSSGERLRRRINELLSPPMTDKGTAAPFSEGLEDYSNLEDFDPYDTTHLFWEQIKQLGYAFRDIKRGDVSDEEIKQLIQACDPVWNILLRIQRRKQ